MRKGHSKGGGSKHKHGRKHGGGYTGSSLPRREPPEHPLITATKQAQTWAKILDAIPDEEIKQLALAEYAKLGEMNDREEV